MSGPEERQRAVDLYSATPMTTAQVVRHLGYPTRQCLERWLAKDPGYAGHMAKPIILMETRAKAIELVLGGMRGSRPPNGSVRASERSATGSGRTARAAWPRCDPRTGVFCQIEVVQNGVSIQSEKAAGFSPVERKDPPPLLFGFYPIRAWVRLYDSPSNLIILP